MHENEPLFVQRRRSVKLPHHDYSSPGLYFLTLCTHNRRRIFGCIDGPSVTLSGAGEIALNTLIGLPKYIPPVELDEYCILPDHIHAMIAITSGGGPTISSIVKRYKTFVSRQINCAGELWQRGFYEHIVRNDRDIFNTRYIQTNAIRHYVEQQAYTAYQAFCQKRGQ